MKTNFNLHLDIEGDYQIGLLNKYATNSFANVTKANNKLHYINVKVTLFIEIPEGAYEIEHIIIYIEKNHPGIVKISANLQTFQLGFKSKYSIDFSKLGSIARLLGFSKRTLKSNLEHYSALHIEASPGHYMTGHCNIAQGSSVMESGDNVIYFYRPNVPPGYINIENSNMIYYPIISCNWILKFTVEIRDQNQNLADFRGRSVCVFLHLKNCK